MPKIITCPECAEPVMLPDGLAESAVLRCPLCDAEYPAREVTETAVESDEPNDGDLPPELTPVEPASEDEAESDEEVAEEEADSTEEAAASLVKCPCCDAQFGLAELIVVSTGRELGPEAAGAIGPDGSIAPADEKASDLPSFGSSGENHAPFNIAIDTGEEAGPSTADGFNFQDEQVERADHRDSALADMASAGPTRRRRDNGKHPFRMIIEIVLGGVAGLAITYYGLNYFGGQRFNWFDIYLPGVAHSAEYRPAWWPGTEPTAAPIETPAQPEEPPMQAPGE